MTLQNTSLAEELDFSISQSIASLAGLLVIIPVIGLFIGGIAELTVMGFQVLA